MTGLPLLRELGPRFFDVVEPAAFPAARLRLADSELAADLGLGPSGDEWWLHHFAAFRPLFDNQPDCLAMRYHGHQFGVYNPQIGDGRGFLLAQGEDTHGRPFDLGTKGSGRTPHSRTGDGRMTLQAGIREVLISDQLAARGVETCRILALVETGERIARNDEPSPTRGAVMVRVQPTHIRIGTFQYHAYHQDAEAIEALMEHAIARHGMNVSGTTTAERACAFLDHVTRANLRLVARWVAAGFVHGVMNSDNMVVTGTSFDYGPSRFLSAFASGFTSAYFDEGGLYSLGRQPEAALRNGARLGEALSLIVDVELLEPVLSDAASAYPGYVEDAFCHRLGIKVGGEPVAGLLVAAMQDRQLLPEAVLFDWRGGDRDRALASPRGADYRMPCFCAVADALASHAPLAGALSADYFAGTDPAHLTIADMRRLWADIEEREDWQAFHEWRSALSRARQAVAETMVET